MKVEHDEDGVSIDMTHEEAQDFAIFLARRRTRTMNPTMRWLRREMADACKPYDPEFIERWRVATHETGLSESTDPNEQTHIRRAAGL